MNTKTIDQLEVTTELNFDLRLTPDEIKQRYEYARRETFLLAMDTYTKLVHQILQIRQWMDNAEKKDKSKFQRSIDELKLERDQINEIIQQFNKEDKREKGWIYE